MGEGEEDGGAGDEVEEGRGLGVDEDREGDEDGEGEEEEGAVEEDGTVGEAVDEEGLVDEGGEDEADAAVEVEVVEELVFTPAPPDADVAREVFDASPAVEEAVPTTDDRAEVSCAVDERLLPSPPLL